MADDFEDVREAVLNVFDTSKAKIDYSRSRDTKRVTITIQDPGGLSEMKMYLVLTLEIDKMERRLGISAAGDSQH